jgi:4-amino-4-deoxy-L-arabinose transferase-like glycosyltransferase
VSVEEISAAPAVRSRGLLEGTASWVDDHVRLMVGAFAALYLVITVPLAARSPLTNDEFFTYYIARAHGLGGLWRALKTGAEQTPPLSHVLSRVSMEVFGNTRLAIRLPEVIAYLGASLCLYAFVQYRSSRLIGLVAMLIPSVTATYTYAFQARSYALVLAFAALALLCWQRTGSRDRRLSLAGLAIALALAVASNYYAVLLLVPLGLGQAVRTFGGRRLDLPVLLAFGGALVPLVLFLPLIEASRKYSSHFYAKATWRDPTDFFAFLTSTSLLPTNWFVAHDRALLALTLVAAAVVVLVAPRLPTRGSRLLLLGTALGIVPLVGLFASDPLFGVTSLYLHEGAVAVLVLGLAGYVVWRARSGRLAGPGVPPDELAAAVGLVLLPLAAVVLAKAATGAFQFRYALPAILGVAILLALALYRLEAGRSVVGLLVLAVLTVGFVGYAVSEYRAAGRARAHQQEVFGFLEQGAGDGLPILLVHPHDYLELASIAPRPLAPRLIYLSDVKDSLRRTGSDTVERGLIELAKLGPLQVRDYHQFVTRRPHFLALVTFHHGNWNWLFPQLRSDGFAIKLRASRGDIQLYDVGP